MTTVVVGLKKFNLNLFFTSFFFFFNLKNKKTENKVESGRLKKSPSVGEKN